MVWFYCDTCGDSIKKPKVQQHLNCCAASGFTCIDCSRNFDRWTVKDHTTCVTEHDKYAKGATKPGGYAAQGFYNEQAGGGPASASKADPAPAAGLEFLATRPPWRCSVCNVTCTSRETLEGHATGAKHRRRAKAALAAQAGTQQPAGQPSAPAASMEAAPAPHANGAGQPASQAAGPDSNGAPAAEPPTPAKKRKIAQTEQPAEDSKQGKKAHSAKAKPSSAVANGHSAADASATSPTDLVANGAGAADQPSSPAAGTSKKQPKWKLLAQKVLQDNGGQMKLKKLQKKVLAAAKTDAAPEAAFQQMLTKWQGSSRFQVEGGLVRLCSS